MPYANSGDVKLYYEEAGKGVPIVWVHEFADDLHGWEAQMQFFSRRYRCVAYNARGYPPSDVPKSASKYSQAIACDDIANVMRHLKIRKAHIIGCSMGAYAALHFALRYPRMAISSTVIGAGYGSDPDKRKQFLADNNVMIKRFEELGTAEAVKPYQIGPARVQFQNKNPRGFAHFCAEFAKHSALGSANTLRGVQGKRPTIYSLESAAAQVPRAAAHHERRRGRQLHRPRRVHQARVPVGHAYRGAQHRPRGQSRRTGAVQQHGGGVSGAGGQRALARTRSAVVE